MRNQVIDITPACTIELLVADNNDFLGIGQVAVVGTALRSDARPIQLKLDTPEGILYPRLELLQVDEASGGAVHVKLRAHGVRWTRGEYADDYDQNLVWLSDNPDPVLDDVTLILKPANLTLGGKDWQGISYGVAFKSAERQIHRVLIHGTWEIGGTDQWHHGPLAGTVQHAGLQGGPRYGLYHRLPQDA